MNRPSPYSRQMRKSELRDLSKGNFDNLTDEIAVMRVAIRRALEMSEKIEDFSDGLELLRALYLATTSLTRMVKIQHFLEKEDSRDDFSRQLNQALTEVREEMGIVDCFSSKPLP